MASRVFLLDRSGSMESCRDDTIGGFNAFVDAQKADGGTMTLVLFDHEVNVLYENKTIGDVEPLTTETFVPRGGTALHDALGHVLKMDLPRDTVCIVLTDGDENSSKMYTGAHVKDLVQNKQTNDGWSFVYLGANQDTIMNAERLGIRTSVGYEPGTQTPELFRALSQTVSLGPLTPGHTQII
jgi:uncharacterized protein YegL